jgi:putative transcriptional regulator
MQGRPIGDDAGVESLRGSLLIASPALWDPNFRRTVVLIGHHDDEGAVGVVLNRASEVAVDEAAPAFSDLVGYESVVFVGGPVQPEAAVVVADFEDPDEAGVLAFGSIGFLSGDADPEDVGGVRRARLFAGYAGWGAGQLEEEVDEGSWIIEPALPDDVFAAEPDGLWRSVLRRKGPEFELLALMPVDPSLN